MKQQKLLLVSTLLFFLASLGFAENNKTFSENGIEPVMEQTYAPAALELNQAHYAKNEKKGFGKLFSWVKKKSVKVVHKVAQVVGITDSAADNNEMWITLALWFFLGGFAAHRWYRGKPAGWNILFILTLGGCGIWAIVDLINILTGKF